MSKITVDYPNYMSRITFDSFESFKIKVYALGGILLETLYTQYNINKKTADIIHKYIALKQNLQMCSLGTRFGAHFIAAIWIKCR